MESYQNSSMRETSQSYGMTNSDEAGQFIRIPSILRSWQALRERWIAVLSILIAALLLGLISWILMTPHYSAESRIEISRKQDKVTNVESVQAEELGQTLEFYQTQYALLEATSLAERVVRSLNLSGRQEFFDLFGVDPNEDGLVVASPKAQERKRRVDLAASILLENISIAPLKGSSIVDIGFTSPDPAFSAKLANEWVEQFIQSNLDRKFASTAEAREFLEKRLQELRGKLEESERRLVGYASNKAIVTLTSSRDEFGKTITERTLVTADLEALNTALAQATAARIAAESEAVQVGGADRNALANLAINGIREKRAEIAAERARLLTQFEAEYPTVKALTSQLVALDLSISREEARVQSGTNTNFRQAVERENELKRKVAELKDRYVRQSRDTIQYNVYQREVDTNRQLYNGLLQRYKEIGIDGVGNNNIAIVDKAKIPDKPSSPILLLNMALAGLLGIGLSGAYVFFMVQIDQSLKDPSKVKSILGLSLLGTVPRAEANDVTKALADIKSALSEAYLSISTNLSFLTESGTPRSFLITSTMPNEGKSTTSLAIAKILARTGKKVILVDADMRNPSLAPMLGETTKTGLSNYLAGEEGLESTVCDTSYPNLSFIGAGPIPPNPVYLLSGGRLIELVSQLTTEYDHVVLDAPPVLGLADIPVIAGAVEGIIYTVGANGAKIHSIQSALERIRPSNVQIFGAIVTKLDALAYGYGYGSAERTED